jgi:hypothetical protein
MPEGKRRTPWVSGLYEALIFDKGKGSGEKRADREGSPDVQRGLDEAVGVKGPLRVLNPDVGSEDGNSMDGQHGSDGERGLEVQQRSGVEQAPEGEQVPESMHRPDDEQNPDESMISHHQD